MKIYVTHAEVFTGKKKLIKDVEKSRDLELLKNQNIIGGGETALQRESKRDFISTL